jgi:hypothetical protein
MTGDGVSASALIEGLRGSCPASFDGRAGASVTSRHARAGRVSRIGDDP